MAGSATIKHSHFRQPDLIDAGMKICQQAFSVWPGLHIANVILLITLPGLEEIPNG
jgi:hypothetical protein